MSDESYPDELRYHEAHDWVRVDGDTATFGITWYAQDTLGEVVFYSPPEVGADVTKDSDYGELESTKAVSALVAPLSGEVVEVNGALDGNESTVNDDPYGEGWLIKVRMSDPSRARRADGRGRLPRARRVAVTLHLADRRRPRRDARRRSASDRSRSSSPRSPRTVRLGRTLDLEPALTEAELMAAPGRAGVAERRHGPRALVPRRRHLRPLRAGGRATR